MQFLDAEAEYLRSRVAPLPDTQPVADDTLTPVTDIEVSSPLSGTRDGNKVTISDPRTFGTMATAGKIAAVADIPAQTIDAAYNQANLQATINALVNKVNELLANARTANHLTP